VIDDPDGNRVTLTAPREAELEHAREWAKDTIEGDFIVETAGRGGPGAVPPVG
jgi:hypothetical protein